MQIWPWWKKAPKAVGVDRVVEVGVLQHEQRVVAAELEHDALQVPARSLGELRPVAVEPVKLIRRTWALEELVADRPASPGRA